MGKMNPERLKEIWEFYQINGEEHTLAKFSITHESFRRYKREYFAVKREDAPVETSFLDKNVILKKIADRFTPVELRAMAEGQQIGAPVEHNHIIDFSGTSFKFAFFTDSHIGSIFFKEELYFKMLEECKKQGVEAFFHSGDVCEGFSNRPGHVYELSHIGFDKQKDYAIELLSQIDKPVYVISGNHDLWYKMSAGAVIVKDIAAALPNVHYLGNHFATLPIKNTKIMLWHGEDASSYATSYRVSKIIESLTGGEKPNLLLCGHTHKMINMQERNVHAISGGALCMQSNWMKSKRLANHSGFWIITATINNSGQISRLLPEWFPAYV